MATILAAYDNATHSADVRTFAAEGTVSGEGLTGTFHSWRDDTHERDEDTLGPRHETTLRIGMTADPRRLFDLLDSEEVERRALAVVTTADRLEAEGEAWAQELMARGEWPPDEDVEP